MKHPTPFVFLASLVLLAAAPIQADTTIVSDTFGADVTTATANLANYNSATGRTADFGGEWVGYSGGTNIGWKTVDGYAYYGTASTTTAMAGFELGSTYFSSNPGVYTLSVSFSLTYNSSSTKFFGLGFSQSIATANSNGFQNATAAYKGTPWIFIRENGEVNVRSDNTTNIVASIAGNSGTVTNTSMTLVLDTTQTNWTLEASIGATAIDLNGASAGTAYTFSSNPTSIGSVGLVASSAMGANSITSFSLTKASTVPEPATASLLLGGGVLSLVGLRRRRLLKS